MARHMTSEEARATVAMRRTKPKGRPRLDVTHLADEVATIVLERDRGILIEKPVEVKDGDRETLRSLAAQEERKRQAADRVSRMCKGRVATKVEIGGVDGKEEVLFKVITVGCSNPR